MISFHDIELIPVGIRSMIPQTNGSDGTPFARVIKDFVIQGGALDGSGDEATSIFGGYIELIPVGIRSMIPQTNGSVKMIQPFIHLIFEITPKNRCCFVSRTTSYTV
jgi:hypothetical protein